MADDPANRVLDLLRALRGDVAEVKSDLAEIKQRLGLRETQIGFHEAQYASLSVRLDRISGDVMLIKRRLDLVEA